MELSWCALLILVLQILGSTWSSAQPHRSTRGFGFAPRSFLYSSSPYSSRLVHDAASFRSKTESTLPHIPFLSSSIDVTPTFPAIDEKQIISSLLHNGERHHYALMVILRGLKLLQDWSISDISHCAHEALSQPNKHQPLLAQHAAQFTLMEHNEAKYIVMALLTEANYLEFCLKKAVRTNIRKQVYDSLVSDMASIIKGRQLKQIDTSPTAIDSTTLIEDTLTKILNEEIKPPASTSTSFSVEEQSSTSTTPTNPIGETNSTTISATSASTPTTTRREAEQATVSPTIPTSFEKTITQNEHINNLLNKELLTSFSYNTINEPWPAKTPNKMRSKIPLIYHHGTIPIGPDFGYMFRPHLSFFTIGEIDPEIMAENAVPLFHPELFGRRSANEVADTTTQSRLEPQQENNSSKEALDDVPLENTPPSVKKMLNEDDFKLPGPFVMERHHVKRSSSLISPEKSVADEQVDGEYDAADDGKVSGGSNPALNDYPLHFSIAMKSEAIPVISVPGEIPDLGHEINIPKELPEPASTAESPIVLKVEKVPTRVDTLEFWNTQKDDRVQGSSTHTAEFQNFEEFKLPSTLVFFDDDLTTLNSEIQGPKTNEADETSPSRFDLLIRDFTETTPIIEESSVDQNENISLTDVESTIGQHSQQSPSVTERPASTTSIVQGENKTTIPVEIKVSDSKEIGESSEESASDESMSSSEEDVTDKLVDNEQSFQTTSSEHHSLLEHNVYESTASDGIVEYFTEESVQNVTNINDETSTTSEENSANTTEETFVGHTEIGSDDDAVDKTEEPAKVSGRVKRELSKIHPESTSDDNGTLNTTVQMSRNVTESEPTGIAALNRNALYRYIIERPVQTALHSTTGAVASDESNEWDPDFDLVVEEFSSAQIIKDDIPDEYVDYSLSLLGELAKPIDKTPSNNTKSALSNQEEQSASSLNPASTHSSTPAKTESQRRNSDGNQYLLPPYQNELGTKEPQGGVVQRADTFRGRRQAHRRVLPSSVLKLLKEKGLDPEAMANRRKTSINNNQIPMSPQQKLSKARTKKILMSLSEKKNTFEDDSENETDDKDNSSIMELINVKRLNQVHHLFNDEKSSG